MSLLDTLGLTPEALIMRRSSVGGSDANTIMGGVSDRLLNLWREKRGEKVGDDLSDILAVQMGSFTEPLNRAWYEKHTGNVVELVGEVCRSDDHGFPMGCTLDGVAVDPFGDRLVFEAKHVGTRSTDAEVFERYVPQLTHNCIVAGFDRAILSVFKGNGDWAMFEYALDGDYATTLIEREQAFWQCVQSGEPPCPMPPPPAPKPVTWDKARVAQAQLGNNPMHKKYPRQMLRSRTVSEGVRTVFPGATSGMYVPEEVADFDDRPRGTPTTPQAQRARDLKPDTPALTDESTPARRKAEEWVDAHLEAIEGAASTDVLDDVRASGRKAIAKLEREHPDLYGRVIEAEQAKASMLQASGAFPTPEADILAQIAKTTREIDINSLISTRMGELDDEGQARVMAAGAARVEEIRS